MRFIDLHIHLQQLILTLYILSITLEIICVIINTLYLKKLVDFITSVTFFSISILQTFAMLEILINKKEILSLQNFYIHHFY